MHRMAKMEAKKTGKNSAMKKQTKKMGKKK
jgi:hypothetical protein